MDCKSTLRYAGVPYGEVMKGDLKIEAGLVRAWLTWRQDKDGEVTHIVLYGSVAELAAAVAIGRALADVMVSCNGELEVHEDFDSNMNETGTGDETSEDLTAYWRITPGFLNTYDDTSVGWVHCLALWVEPREKETVSGLMLVSSGNYYRRVRFFWNVKAEFDDKFEQEIKII